MIPLRRFLSRVAGRLASRRRDRELTDEIRQHLDLIAEQHRQKGLSRQEADAAARREFGGIEQVKEVCRDERGFAALDSLLHDLRRGLVALGRTPRATAIIVLTLAIGIGANTAIFSIVDGVLLRRAPIDGFERLVMVWETDRNSGTIREPGSIPDYLDYQQRARTVDTLAGFMAGDASVAQPGADPARLAAVRVSAGALPMVGVRPIVGRLFTDEDDRPGGGPMVVISEALWTRLFNRDPGAVGRSIDVDEKASTIVGVAPDVADFGLSQVLAASVYGRGFVDRGNPRVDLWLPLRPDPQELPRGTHPLIMIGQLAREASPAAAQQELADIAADLERGYPENANRGVFVERLSDVVFGPVRPALLMLLGAVGLVLLVACANVANLLLARGVGRLREVAVQSALGASMGRIARQFLLEGLLLTLAGAVCGVALAVVGVKALVAAAPATVPRVLQVGVDLRVLAVTLVVCVGVGVLFGLVPTLQARAADLQSALRSATGRSGGSTDHVGWRIRSAIVVAELALSVMLLIGAALLMRSFRELQRVDPGFDAAGVLKAEFQLPSSRYPSNFAVFPNFKEMHALTDALVERVGALGGVESAAVAGNHPLDPGFTNSFVVVGREAEARNWPEISIRRVTPGYFRTVGLRLVRGRLLERSDTPTSPPVLLINESAARRFFGDREPLGAMLRFWGASRRVVGIVADERMRGIAVPAPLAAYAPLAQAPSVGGAGVLLVRTSGDLQGLATEVRNVLRDLDPGIPMFAVEPLEQTVSKSIAERRFAMLLLGLFAATALTLAAIGVHGAFSYTVEQRTREIGIRMALGAQPRQTLRLLMEQGALLTGAGLAIGLLGAVGLTRLLASLLFEVTPTDPAAFAAVATLMVAVALLATFLSARGVLKVEPVVALRAE
jgi:putative ABC transport system permease protein